MALTPEEKTRVRHHTGYVGVAAVYTFVFGVPAAVQTQFSIEGAMDNILAESEELVRKHLAILDKIQMQQIDDLELLALLEADEIKFNPDEQKKLDREYFKWVGSLCNLFGCIPNPFDQRFKAMGGVNVPVIG
jgi:hypothetical protein